MEKRSIADLLSKSMPATPEQRAAGNLEIAQSILKMRDDFERMRVGPHGRAMEKLEAGISALQADPEIVASEVCKDLLDMIQELLERAWPHDDVKKLVSPLQNHFDGEKSKTAHAEKNKKKDDKRKMFANFLDKQKDILDTPRLAARLRKAFAINSVRGSEDEVRRWKKLRVASRT